MTVRELAKLKNGTRVAWREGKLSPRAGEVTETGTVYESASRGGKYVLWPDGQETIGCDEWALQNVEVKR